jgi:type VI secretion system protein ImpM
MTRIGYFGKIPTRSDFIKAADDVPLMGVLDQWLAQVMSQLSQDPRWKINYDAMPPLQFAFVGTRRKHAIAGHIVASHDQSGRRFPFLLMQRLDLPEAIDFIGHSPLALAPLWRATAALARQVMTAAEPEAILQSIPDTVVELDMQTHDPCDSIDAFGRLLGGVDVKQLMLALGLLLQPVMRSGASQLDRSLLLPLPQDESLRHGVAAYWVSLIAPFLQRADFELSLFLVERDGRALLVVGFNGASADTLHGIIDPLMGNEQHIDFADTSWVAEQLTIDIDVRALASYLDQPGLSLALARTLFHQSFTGN